MKKRILTVAAAALAASLLTQTAPAHAEPPPVQSYYPDIGGGNDPAYAYALATLWQFKNHGGARLSFVTSYAGCTASYSNYDYREQSLSQEDFTNRTSSIADYNNCDTALWDADYYGGERSGGADGWFDAGSTGYFNLDTWDNRANSLSWS